MGSAARNGQGDQEARGREARRRHNQSQTKNHTHIIKTDYRHQKEDKKGLEHDLGIAEY